MEKDPTFAFRVIVDIASKVFRWPSMTRRLRYPPSVKSITYVRHVGGRRLDTEKVRNTAGRASLTFRTPDWEDLAVTEIGKFGGTSIQFAHCHRITPIPFGWN